MFERVDASTQTLLPTMTRGQERPIGGADAANKVGFKHKVLEDSALHSYLTQFYVRSAPSGAPYAEETGHVRRLLEAFFEERNAHADFESFKHEVILGHEDFGTRPRGIKASQYH